MSKNFLLLVFLVFTQWAYAVLPPQFQNKKDLDVMVKFIQSNPEVMAKLDTINFRQRIVVYGEGCEAKFTRKKRDKPKGWVGPQESLVFDSSTCKIKK